ncbi:MAG: molybdopterin-dependent oxidoreductase [Myxococcales bacterium]|nr:molybdopterin-dependent oxidoreductase [Myxococcales bacterium]
MAVKVHVVAGFLGAGKTTVLSHLLKGLSGERVGLVVNDFGEAAIDREILAPDGGDVREIRGSCVCCTAPEGFVAELASLLEGGQLDRIFVEPTGLARPADVVDTLRRAPFFDQLQLQPLIVVVDPARIVRGEVSDDVLAQAAVGDVIVANRIDQATSFEMELYRSWLQSLWPPPRQAHETQFGEVPHEVLQWGEQPAPEDRMARSEALFSPRRDHDHDHDHAHGFEVRTLSWDPDVVFHRGRLLDVVRELSAERVKGIFRTDEGTVLLQRAASSLQESTTGRRSDSRVDVIVAHPGTEALDAAEQALATAVLDPSERQARAHTLEVALPDGSVRAFDRVSLAALPDPVPDVSVLVPNRQGAAARISEVLKAAAVGSSGDAVVVAADGYVTEPVPVDALLSGVLLHSMDDEPLPQGKGGPFRLLIPGDAGPGGPCANVKAVVRIALRGPS